MAKNSILSLTNCNNSTSTQKNCSSSSIVEKDNYNLSFEYSVNNQKTFGESSFWTNGYPLDSLAPEVVFGNIEQLAVVDSRIADLK